MSDSERVEKLGAEREARDASVHRTSRGPVARAVQAALTRYLSAESYRDREQPKSTLKPHEHPKTPRQP